MDVGIFSNIESGLENFLLLLYNYFEYKHVRTVQTKSSYALLPTPLYHQIREINKHPNQPFKKNLTGFLAIRNLESQKLFHVLINDLGADYFKPVQTGFESQYKINQWERNYFNIGEFAGVCSRIIILLTCDRPIENQLQSIPLLNFFSKRYRIYLTQSPDLPYQKRREQFQQAQEEVKRFFLERNLNLLDPIKPIRFDEIGYCPENNEVILDLFQLFEEVPCLLQKRNNEYIFKIVMIHDNTIDSSVFFGNIESNQTSDNPSPARGVDIHVINRKVNNNKIILQIFDLVGNDRWQFIAESFLSNSRGYYLLFDRNLPESIKTLKVWVDLLEKRNKNIPIIILEKVNSNEEPHNQDSLLWIIDHPQIIDYIQISPKFETGIESAINKLLYKLIEINYIQTSEDFDNITQVYELPLEKERIYQEISFLLHDKNYNSIQEVQSIQQSLLDYFSQYNSNESHQIFDNLFSSDDPFIAIYGLNLIRYYAQDLNQNFNQLFSLITTTNPMILYYILTTILFLKNHYHLYNQPINNLSIWEDRIKTLILDLFETQENKSNRELDLDIQIILLRLIIEFKIPFQTIKSHVYKKIIHYCPDLRNQAWNALKSLLSDIKEVPSRSEFLAKLDNQEKAILISLIETHILDINFFIRKNAIKSYGDLRDSRAILTLLTNFVQKEDTLKLDICNALHEIDPNRFQTSQYPEILKNLSRKERIYLCDAIEHQLMNQDDDIRLSAVMVLRDLHDADTVKTMIIALCDYKESIRFIAVQALSEFKDTRTIIPLLECFINTTNSVLKKEIINSLTNIDFTRFHIGDSPDLFWNLTALERLDLINRILYRLNKSQDETKRLNFIKYLGYFNEIHVIKLLVELLKDPFLQIQHLARENLLKLSKIPEPNGIHDLEQINLLFRALDDFILYTRIDMHEFLNKFPWQHILKAILFHPLSESNRIYTVLSNLLSWNLTLLYEIRKMSITDVLKHSLQIESSEMNSNTIISYLSLSYPYSYEFLVRYVKEHENLLQPTQIEQLKRVCSSILQKFTMNISSGQNENEKRLLL